MSVDASWSGLREFESGLRQLGSRAPRVIKSSLLEAAKHGKAVAKRDITAVYNLPSGTVGKTISARTVGSLEAEVRASSPEIPLSQYKPQPPGPQPRKHPVITIEVVKGRRTSFKGAFVAAVYGKGGNPGGIKTIKDFKQYKQLAKGLGGNGGHLGVFTRVGTSRLPIKERKGIGPGQMMLAKRLNNRIPDETADYYQKRLASKILAALGGKF